MLIGTEARPTSSGHIDIEIEVIICVHDLLLVFEFEDSY